MIWGAISRALRTPSRIDRELFAPANPPFILAGGPNFESEKLLAYELGYRAELKPGVALSLATFYHDYDNLRSVEGAATAASPAVLANGLEGKSYGAELSIDYPVRAGWRMRLGYTEQRVESHAKPGAPISEVRARRAWTQIAVRVPAFPILICCKNIRGST